MSFDANVWNSVCLVTFVKWWPSSLKHTHTHTMCMSGTHSSKRKLQRDDKVWEHNGLSSARTEARTSLAPKGQQASPSFYSAPPLIIVRHYHHTLMAFILHLWEPSRNTDQV